MPMNHYTFVDHRAVGWTLFAPHPRIPEGVDYADHVRATVQSAVVHASQAAYQAAHMSLATDVARLLTAPSRRKSSSLRYEGRSSLAGMRSDEPCRGSSRASLCRRD